MDFDQKHMLRALALAEKSIGLASPNPQVGCVLVRDGQVIGEGAHHYDQFDHAEIVALKQAGSRGTDAQAATAYVTLEPCSHHGRTGPCADALLRAGISRCVVATVDPNPQVAGQGIARLRAAGVEVVVGVCQQQARTLNDAFAWSITHGRPFVTLKAGLSVDGMLAPSPVLRRNRQPHWLTGKPARAEVQQLRHASDAILTGIGTVLADDPALTDRSGLPRRRPLMRVVLDSQLRLPVSSQLVRSCTQDLWVFCLDTASIERRSELEQAGVRVTSLPTLNPEKALEHLHGERILSVLLEAGSQLNAAFLRDWLVDRAVLYYAESELGPEAVPFAYNGMTPFALEQQMLAVSKRPVGADVCVSGLLHDPWSGAPEIV